MVECKFWVKGACKYGNGCRFEHIGPPGRGSAGGGGRRGAFEAPHNPSHGRHGRPDQHGGRPQGADQPLPYHLSRDGIISDLKNEAPSWVLSAYGPGYRTPIQLFGGEEREKSFEEMRLNHYMLRAQGQEALAAHIQDDMMMKATAQNQNAIDNADAALQYILQGEHQHPNRIDIAEQFPKGMIDPTQPPNPNPPPPGPVQGPFQSSNAFGQPPQQPSAGAFGAGQSALGQKPNPLGGPSPFGNQALGQPPAAAPSVFGASPLTSQPFGRQPSQPAVSSPFAQQPQQPSPSPFAQQPQQPAPSPFGAAAGIQQNPLGAFGKAQPPQATPFGQPPAQPGPFGQPPASQPPQSSPFGQPPASQQPQSTPFGQPPAQPGPFGQPPASQPPQSNPFGQPPIQQPQSSPFGQPQAQQPKPAPFGQNPAPSQPPAPFGAQPQRPAANAFGQPAAPASNGFQTGTSPFGQAAATPLSQAGGGFGAAVQAGAQKASPFTPSTQQSPQNPLGPQAGSQPGARLGPEASPYPPNSPVQHPHPSTYSTRDASGQLSMFKGRRVVYRDSVPGFQNHEGSWERIWFPDGPPPYNETTELPLDKYDEGTRSAYQKFAQTGQWDGGQLPLLPPRREWCKFDF